MSNNVEHPSWYTQYTPEVRLVARACGFYLGNTVKYLCRAGSKTEDPTEDLMKACQYIRFEVEWEAAINSDDGTPNRNDIAIAIRHTARSLQSARYMFRTPHLPGHDRLDWVAQWLRERTTLDGLEDELTAWEATRAK